MQEEDVGCHVAAMCSQTVEETLKGYVFLNGATPDLGHRPDKYLPQLLDASLWWRAAGRPRVHGLNVNPATTALQAAAAGSSRASMLQVMTHMELGEYAIVATARRLGFFASCIT